MARHGRSAVLRLGLPDARAAGAAVVVRPAGPAARRRRGRHLRGRHDRTVGLRLLLVFLRAAILEDVLRVDRLDQVTEETSLLVFLGAWLGCFYLGVLLLGIALLVAGTVPRWVPSLLFLYVVSQVTGDALGDLGTVIQFFVLAIAFTGAAVAATERGVRREELRVTAPR